MSNSESKMATALSIPLNFPVFYQCVIKERLTLKQYDAVNLLLLGKRYSDCVEIQISQSMAANYVSGKKKISKDIITQLLECPASELKRRLQALGLQNLDQGAFCMKYLLYSRQVQLNDYDRARLLHLVRNDKDLYNFLTEVFLMAIKCPPQESRPLTKDEQTLILGYQQPFLMGDIDDALTPEQIAESEKILADSQQSAAPDPSLVIRDGKDIFKSFSTAYHRTQLVNLPQEYNVIPKFFYSFTGVKKDYARDNQIADLVRPYYKSATLHVITCEEWSFFMDASCFDDLVPRGDLSTLCILLEGCESILSEQRADSFRKGSGFTDVEVISRVDNTIDENSILASLVFLTGETR